MKTLFFLLFLTFCVNWSYEIKCYTCAYIEGIKDDNLNPDCIDKISTGRIDLEEGAACIKAQGHHGPNPFTLRLAFRPNKIYDQDRIHLPGGHGSTTCHAAGIMLERVGHRIINSLDLCEVCNDQNACNSSGTFQFNVLVLIFSLGGFWTII